MVCQGTDHVGGGSQVIMVCQGRLMVCQGEINGLSGDRPWRRWESGNNGLINGLEGDRLMKGNGLHGGRPRRGRWGN